MSNEISVLSTIESVQFAEESPPVSERRTWDSDVRSPWNPKIHTMLKAVDLHTELYISTGDAAHAGMAELLREYVLQLKRWIHQQEGH